ncbi:MAG: hypothetical protein CMJ64_13645 [Planctomycetaceae bacterium]|nr:hypothetical protein [Planctomycetaceae bacterium]
MKNETLTRRFRASCSRQRRKVRRVLLPVEFVTGRSARPTNFLAAAFASLVVVLVAGTSMPADEVIKPAKPTTEQARFFETKVRPLLAKHCYECHGKDEQEGKLRLDSLEAILNGGKTGPAVVSKKPDESLIIKAVAYEDSDTAMPPEEKLADEQVAVLRHWVEMGTPWPGIDQVTIRAKRPANEITDEDREFWSFQPLNMAEPPKIDDPWVRTPIDRLIQAKLQERGIRPNGLADDRTLIRRAYFVLTGLPPTPEEVDAFVSTDDPKAYEKLIDGLLDSPHYGERWARHWMDVARFAESHGYEQDYDRPHAYHYRDFLITALNQDMPYDQFVQWQVAGDELAPNDPLAMMATGFLGAGAFPTQLTEAEFETARYDELDDMASTVGSTFLALTVGCARCHEHKYDPIPMIDYYRLVSTFTTTIRSEVDIELNPNDEQPKTVKVQVTSEGFPHTKHHADGRGFPHFYPKTFFLTRGDVKQKQQEVDAGFLQVLTRGGKEASHWHVAPPADWTRTSFRRASLARWLTDAKHGAGQLAARVIVNRLWQHHFGRGIVATPNDFGYQGQRPTHPELLDWLARDLIAHGWRLKRLHKLIMTSTVYMQSSDVGQASSLPSSTGDQARQAGSLPHELDPENLLYWRRTPRRLEGEAIRDAMLHVGGILDSTMYGPGSLDENMRRRSVYFFIKRSKLIPTMMLFDWPEHLVSIGRRSNTTIAPQALMLINNSQARACADGFGKRLAERPIDEAITRGYRLALGRAPTDDELKTSATFVASQTTSYEQASKSDAERLALANFCQALMSLNEFVYVD